MIIRSLVPEDLEKLEEIHARFYKDEFTFPDFFHNFICCFAVIENDTIVSAGGVRLIAESILITNKSFPVKTRRKALYDALETSKFICNKFGYEQLHAFVQGDIWKQQLVKAGFKDCNGNAIFLNVS